MINLILDIIFPPICIGCKTSGKWLCKDCLASLPINPKQYQQDKYTLYIACQKSELLKKLIHQYKYSGKKIYCSIISAILTKCIDKFLLKKTFIFVPIPLFWYKKNNRGYNQVEMLTKNLARKYNTKSINLLKRVKNTKPQAQLNKLDRKTNLTDAFIIDKKNKKIVNSDCNIIIVDDIYTTGETMRNAYKILSENNFTNISCLAISKGL
jgi:competence protein ComFC